MTFGKLWLKNLFFVFKVWVALAVCGAFWWLVPWLIKSLDLGPIGGLIVTVGIMGVVLATVFTIVEARMR
jgi:hypothetical protein